MVLTPVTETPNSASTAALISGLDAPLATRTTTAFCSDSMVDFSAMCGASTLSSWRASTAAAACFLAIEPGLQFLNRGAGQDQRLVAHDVVDVRANGRQQVDAVEVRRSAGETDVERVAVDDQSGLAEAELAELLAQRLGLAVLHIEIVDDHEVAA